MPIAKCQKCGRTAEVTYVKLGQNIGAFWRRWWKSLEGNLCRDCIGEAYWPFTLTTLFLGWWGLISSIVTPGTLLLNTIYYAKSLTLKPPAKPDQAKPVKLTPALLDKIEPFHPQIAQQLKSGKTVSQVAATIAPLAKVSPDAIELYIKELSRLAKKRQTNQ